MRIEYRVNEKLPPLAWVAEVAADIVIVHCGENVEVHESFFVEGAWGGTS